jgi:cobalt-precorrin-7 (C5)-methyltransferase
MLTLIGMGPGHLAYVTPAAIDAIRAADIVIAFDRIADTAAQITPAVVRVSRVQDLLAYLDPTRHVAVLASGDPGFYGILDYLQQQQIAIDRVVPGTSSMQYLMAKIRKHWHDVQFLSLHGRTTALAQVKHARVTALLTDARQTPHRISQELAALGLRGTVYVGYNLSYADERIITAAIGDALEFESDLAIMVVALEAEEYAG